MRRSPCLGLILLLVGAFAWTGCGDNDLLEPDPDVAPLVGDWDAVELQVTPPDMAPIDLLAGGATFFLNIQPSGQYTATLVQDGGAAVEMGRMEVRPSQIRMVAELPSPGTTTATYELDGDRLTLEGETNLALGVPDLTTVVDVRIGLQRRPGES